MGSCSLIVKSCSLTELRLSVWRISCSITEWSCSVTAKLLGISLKSGCSWEMNEELLKLMRDRGCCTALLSYWSQRQWCQQRIWAWPQGGGGWGAPGWWTDGCFPPVSPSDCGTPDWCPNARRPTPHCPCREDWSEDTEMKVKPTISQFCCLVTAELTMMPRALRMLSLHMGQVQCSFNQGSTHILWKTCLQGHRDMLDHQQSSGRRTQLWETSGPEHPTRAEHQHTERNPANSLIAVSLTCRAERERRRSADTLRYTRHSGWSLDPSPETHGHVRGPGSTRDQHRPPADINTAGATSLHTNILFHNSRGRYLLREGGISLAVWQTDTRTEIVVLKCGEDHETTWPCLLSSPSSWSASRWLSLPHRQDDAETQRKNSSYVQKHVDEAYSEITPHKIYYCNERLLSCTWTLRRS